MFNNIYEDLIAFSKNGNFPKWSIFFMVFVYPTTWPIIIYRFGQWTKQRCNIIIVKQIFFIIYVIIRRIVEIILKIEIRSSAKIGKGLVIPHLGNITIGKNAVVGDYCCVLPDVVIGGAGRGEKYGYPHIGNNCYIGAGAKILGKIVIGNDVMIGANAVVVDSVPESAVVAGVPAKVISYKGSDGFIKYKG